MRAASYDRYGSPEVVRIAEVPTPSPGGWAGAEQGGDRLPQRGLHAPDEPYDLILDLVAHRSVFAYRRALAPGGRYRCVGGSVRALLRVLTIGWMAGRLTRRRIGVLAVREGPTRFEPLAGRCVAGE